MSTSELSLPELRAALERKRAGTSFAEETALYEASLRAFVEAAWQMIEPNTIFCPNWHIDAICEHLEAATRGELHRLLINLPPRHMKSLLVSVLWPAWCWTHSPHLRFLTASYGSELSERFAIKTRDLLLSPWYQERWPALELKDDMNRTNRYENTAGGARVAISVGGEATGEGGDILIADDPHKAEEAGSASARRRVIDWHDGSFGYRFDNPRTGVEVVVMQRLHEEDLAGHLLERDGWTHLCLPARYERQHPYPWAGDPRTRESELLWPEHFPDEQLRQIEQTMGSYRRAGQLQQRPAAIEGELLKRAWWRFYDPGWIDDPNGQLPRFHHIVSSWDTSFTAKTSSDYVVGQVWGIHRADRYLLRSYRAQVGLEGTKQAMRQTAAWVKERWPHAAQRILIEKSANGHEIISQLKRELTGVIGIDATHDKETRAIAAAAPLEAGNIYLPGRAAPEIAAGYQAPDWVAAFIEEAAGFPNTRYDDQVDSFSQAINHATKLPTRPATFTAPTGQLPIDRVARGLEGPLDQHRRHTRTLTEHRRAVTIEELAVSIGATVFDSRR